VVQGGSIRSDWAAAPFTFSEVSTCMLLRTPFERPLAPAEVLLALFPGLWKNTY